MSQPKNPCKTMIFNEKKVEKNVKKGLPSSGIPVGWNHNLMNIELFLTMKGQTLC